MNKLKKIPFFLWIPIIGILCLCIKNISEGTIYYSFKYWTYGLLPLSILFFAIWLIMVIRGREGSILETFKKEWINDKVSIIIMCTALFAGIFSAFDVGTTQIGHFFEKNHYTADCYIEIKSEERNVEGIGIANVTRRGKHEYVLNFLYFKNFEFNLDDEYIVLKPNEELTLEEITDIDDPNWYEWDITLTTHMHQYGNLSFGDVAKVFVTPSGKNIIQKIVII